MIGRNLVASTLGNTWAAVVQIAFVPVYIDLLGVEAYGLIGVYALLQAALSIFDLGMTPTLSRETARFGAGAETVEGARNLLRSMECCVLVVALLIAALAFATAPWLVGTWLKVEQLEAASAIHALELMAVLIGLRFLGGLYRAAIGGLQRLVWLNSVVAAFATLRGAGVVVFLVWFAPTIEAFFAYQCVVTFLELGLLRWRAWSLLASAARPAFSLAALRKVWGFSGAMALISALSLVVSQVDKALLSAMLPLATFGCYALASSVAGALNLLAAPIGQVAYPRLNELAARAAPGPMEEAFHALAQTMTLAIAPAALVLALFAAPVLELWTQDTRLSAAAAPLLALLSVGVMLNAFMSVPCMVPIAHGRTRGLVLLNAVGLGLIVPAVYFGVAAFGAIAAGYAWIAVNGLGVACMPALLDAHLAAGAKWRWLAHDVGLPCACALAVAAIVRLACPAEAGAMTLVVIVLAWLAATGAALAASPACRRQLSRR